MKLIKTSSQKIILSILVLSCVAVIGVRLRRNFSQIRSVQAFVNGEIIFVRAAIPGELELKSEKIKLSNQLEKGALIGTIKSSVENPRVSVLKIDSSQLKTRLQDVQQQISGVKQQIRNRLKLMKLFKQQTNIQKNLQRNYARQQIKQYEGQQIQSQAVEKLALAEAKRYTFLSKEGAVSGSRAESETATAKQAEGKVKEIQSQIEQAKLALEATKAGLQLEGTRTLSYPETRVYELEVELTDLKQQEKNLEKQLQSIQSQLVSTSKELQVQQIVSVLAPTTGVIWSIDTQPQEKVEANKSIIQLLNCNNLWVEAFVSETDANKLVIGQAAEVVFSGLSNTQWKGRVETIRAGTGRIQVGQYVVEPPPEIARRQLPIRVATVRIKVDLQKTPSFSNFCLAGRSVNVRFLEPNSFPF
ncbi:HlyD family efflux transporter periplasmic adaptor subunit [Scytonema hofmannii FACHB-248]|uniref:HlyD family efflux transporter periplasmic adaptor subunit n=1 Tax=Scytonema hofmannii FACHB-248 TaxID=1842502 RepID=A0ABR8GVE3_9CYAN|nr:MULTISPECIES: HlyD family efflux transporter periplasmic adaptor subunit [Nostocales]MBD2607040.1 HlyD family efflux transporter periplasmic adaptor subunit [Scytonema hofmannii FACHB-248]